MHVSAQFTGQNLSCGRQQVFRKSWRPKARGAQEAGPAPESETSDSAEGTDSTAVAEEDSNVVVSLAGNNALTDGNVPAGSETPADSDVLAGSDALATVRLR